MREARIDGELRRCRLDGRLEQDVQHGLLPEQLGTVRKGCGAHVREGRLVRRERQVARRRHPCGDELQPLQRLSVFLQRDVVPDPLLGRVADHLLGLGDLEVARSAEGKLVIAHGLEWHPDDEPHPVAIGLHERLDGHIDRNLVRLGPRRQEEHEGHEQGGRAGERES